MAQQLLTPPAVLPVTLAEAKVHERISLDDAANDASIESMLYAATRLAEEYTSRAFITQTWKYDTVRFGEFVAVPRPRLQIVNEVSFTDLNNQTTIIDPSYYFINTVYEPGRVIFKPGTPFPFGFGLWFDCIPGFLSVTYNAGYGDTADDVPFPIKEAILQIFGHLYENRESQCMPGGAKQLLNPFRMMYI